MRPRTKRPGALLGAATIAALLVVTGPTAAQEIGTGLEEATEKVGQATKGVSGGSATADAPPVPAAPNSDDDSEGHETQDPAPPDHASGGVVDIQVAGEDLVTVGATDARIEDDGEASGDVTLLAIGGSEIVGAHSRSRGGPANDANDPLAPLCEESGGAICIGLLFAETSSSEDGSISTAESRAALAAVCVGGDETEYDGTCQGLLGADLATSDGEIRRDEGTGRTDAAQENELAGACLGGEGDQGACEGLRIAVLRSESTSSAPTADGDGTTERSSFLAAVEAQGEEEVIVDDPVTIAIPPGCPAGQSLLCIFLNQGESFVFVGGAGSRQEVVHVDLLPGLVDGQDLVEAHAGVSETLARNAGPAEVRPGTEVRPGFERAPGLPPGAAGGPAVAGEVAGKLAFTGSELLALGLIGAALLVIGSGALAVACRRAG